MIVINKININLWDTSTSIKWQNITFQCISCPMAIPSVRMWIDNCSLMGFPFRCKMLAVRQARDKMLRILLNCYLLQSFAVVVAYMLQWLTVPRAQPTETNIQFYLWHEREKKTKSNSHENRKNCRKFFSVCGDFIMQTQNAIIMLNYTERPKTWSLNNSNLDFKPFLWVVFFFNFHLLSNKIVQLNFRVFPFNCSLVFLIYWCFSVVCFPFNSNVPHESCHFTDERAKTEIK